MARPGFPAPGDFIREHCLEEVAVRGSQYSVISLQYSVRAIESSVRSTMFIGTAFSRPIKLRRSGTFRHRVPFSRAMALGERRTIPCRSYGAWFKWGPVGTINMALLTELSHRGLDYSLENPLALTFRSNFLSRLKRLDGV